VAYNTEEGVDAARVRGDGDEGGRFRGKELVEEQESAQSVLFRLLPKDWVPQLIVLGERGVESPVG
jgi:hypothetical protein